MCVKLAIVYNTQLLATLVEGCVMATDSSLRQINDAVFECQHIHCHLHHEGLVRVFPDCALCLALRRLADLTRTVARQDKGALAYVATQ